MPDRTLPDLLSRPGFHFHLGDVLNDLRDLLDLLRDQAIAQHQQSQKGEGDHPPFKKNWPSTKNQPIASLSPRRGEEPMEEKKGWQRLWGSGLGLTPKFIERTKYSVPLPWTPPEKENSPGRGPFQYFRKI